MFQEEKDKRQKTNDREPVDRVSVRRLVLTRKAPCQEGELVEERLDSRSRQDRSGPSRLGLRPDSRD